MRPWLELAPLKLELFHRQLNSGSRVWARQASAGLHLRLIIDLSTADDVNTSMCVFGASTKQQQHSWQSHLLIGFIDSKRT